MSIPLTGSAARDYAKTHTGLECVQAMSDGRIILPFEQAFGITFDEITEGKVTASMLVTDALNEFGAMHAGAMMMALRVAGVHAFRSILPSGQSCTATNAHVELLKPVPDNAKTVTAIGEALQKGSTTGLAKAELFAGDQLISYGSFRCHIINLMG